MTLTSHLGSFRSTVTLSWAVVLCLGLLSIGYLTELALALGQLGSPQLLVELDAEMGDSAWLGFQALAAMLRLPIYIITIVIFLIWLNRSLDNLRPLRAGNLEFTNGWAIGWWFIPLANLFKPFQVVREIWRESDPDFDPQMGFLSAAGMSAPAVMGWWWAFWLLSNFSTNVAWRVYDPEKPAFWEITAVLLAAAGALSLAAAILCLVVVRSITKRQQDRYARILARPAEFGDSGGSPAPPQPPVFDQTAHRPPTY